MAMTLSSNPSLQVIHHIAKILQSNEYFNLYTWFLGMDFYDSTSILQHLKGICFLAFLS